MQPKVQDLGNQRYRIVHPNRALLPPVGTQVTLTVERRINK